MKRSLLLLVSTLFASVAAAEPPQPAAKDTQTVVTELVNQRVTAPLAKAEKRRSRFSRAAPVAVQRRVRVLDDSKLTDAQGKSFVRFAVDARLAFGKGSEWTKDAIVGCVYPDERTVYVQQNQKYVPAANLTGAEGKVRVGACKPADTLAQLTR